MSPQENFVGACSLRENQVQQMLSAHKAAKMLKSGAARWHSNTEIETLDGLEGQYLWTEDSLAPAIITFKFDADGVGRCGIFKAVKAGSTVDEGNFWCIPNNPAVGWAAVGLIPQGGSGTRIFVIDGMMVDDQGKIIVMILKKLGDQGSSHLPFCAVRMF